MAKAKPAPKSTTKGGTLSPAANAAPAPKVVYRRVLLKLSGEALLGAKTFGIDRAFADYLAEEIRDAHSLGVELGIVVGGGNIFCGVSEAAVGREPRSADHTG